MTRNAQPNYVKDVLLGIAAVMMCLWFAFFTALRTMRGPDEQSKVKHRTDEKMGIVAVFVEFLIFFRALFHLFTVSCVVAIRNAARSLWMFRAITLHSLNRALGVFLSPSTRLPSPTATFGAKFLECRTGNKWRATLDTFGHSVLSEQGTVSVACLRS